MLLLTSAHSQDCVWDTRTEPSPALAAHQGTAVLCSAPVMPLVWSGGPFASPLSAEEAGAARSGRDELQSARRAVRVLVSLCWAILADSRLVCSGPGDSVGGRGRTGGSCS